MFRLLLNPILFNFAQRIKPNKPIQIPFKNWSIVKGDRVMVRSGSDRGKIGNITKVYRKTNKVVVKGVNVKSKIQKNQAGQPIVKKINSPIHISNVGLYDSSIKKPVRIKYLFHPQTKQKLRVSKKTNKVLFKPKRKNLKRQKRGKNKKNGIKDTPAYQAHQITYQGQDFEAIKKQFEQFIIQKQKKQKMLVFNQ